MDYNKLCRVTYSSLLISSTSQISFETEPLYSNNNIILVVTVEAVLTDFLYDNYI